MTDSTPAPQHKWVEQRETVAVTALLGTLTAFALAAEVKS